MQEPIKDRRGQGAVVIEDFRPIGKRLIGCNHHCPLFIAQTEDLEQKIGPSLVDGQEAEFIDDQQCWSGVFFKLLFYPACGLGNARQITPELAALFARIPPLKKIEPFPVVLIGHTYWDGLIAWMREVQLPAGAIAQQDIDLLSVTDDPAEAAAIVTAYAEANGINP